jgi:hypothetical protein
MNSRLPSRTNQRQARAREVVERFQEGLWRSARYEPLHVSVADPAKCWSWLVDPLAVGCARPLQAGAVPQHFERRVRCAKGMGAPARRGARFSDPSQPHASATWIEAIQHRAQLSAYSGDGGLLSRKKCSAATA